MSNRSLFIALIVSVAVNLLAVGFWIGRYSSDQLRPMPPDPTMGFARIVRSFPESRQRELRPLVRAQFQAVRPIMRDVRARHKALFEALAQDPVDATLLEHRLTALRASLGASQQANHQAFARFIDALTADERQQWLAWVRERPGRDRRRESGTHPSRRHGSPDRLHR